MKAALITIGDELLIGQVVNTNASWIGEHCAEKGIEIVRMSTVGDQAGDIQRELETGFALADVVFVTGGLGPTHDDITREAVADFFGVPCELDESILDTVKARFERLGISMPPANVSQAMVPRGFKAVNNPQGSAPGLWHTYSDADSLKQLVVTPGVPHEMKTMFENEILPRLSDPDLAAGIVSKTILITGIGESSLARRLGDIRELLDANMTLAYLPGIQRVRVRLTAYIKRDAGAGERLDQLDRLIHARAGKYIYGYGVDTLEATVVRLLIENSLTLSTAESCTGGMLASRLTDIPGSSACLSGGMIAYSNESKVRELGVTPASLEMYGAVSEQVAMEMAVGVRKRFGTDLGVAATGIMGPAGGTEDKPVGTVWISVATIDETSSKMLTLGEHRVRNKERATTSALDMIRLWISSAE